MSQPQRYAAGAAALLLLLQPVSCHVFSNSTGQMGATAPRSGVRPTFTYSTSDCRPVTVTVTAPAVTTTITTTLSRSTVQSTVTNTTFVTQTQNPTSVQTSKSSPVTSMSSHVASTSTPVTSASTPVTSSLVATASTSSTSNASAAATATPASTPPQSESSQPQAQYVTGNPNLLLPCVPGTFLCTSNTTWDTCDYDSSDDWVYEYPRNVAAGTMCLPFYSPYTNDTQQYAQQADAPQGYYRDDRIGRARPDGNCTVEGSLECTDGGYQFDLCDQGGWVEMGSVANGTICQNGTIVAAS